MDSLLSQGKPWCSDFLHLVKCDGGVLLEHLFLALKDIGFFDTTKTGDITSRLSSDTTLVGDQGKSKGNRQLYIALIQDLFYFYRDPFPIFILFQLAKTFLLSVTLNVNVFLRSVVQAIGVLIFMFVVSWQLSIIAFISVPVVTALSKWYGNFLRSLTKLMQKKVCASFTLCSLRAFIIAVFLFC